MTEGPDWTEADLAHLRLEGLEFLNRLQSGSATKGDEAAFLAWRCQSLAHEEAFRAAVRLQRVVRGALAKMPQPANASVTILSQRHLVSRRALVGGAVAASAVGVATWTGLPQLVGLGATKADYRTSTGQRRVVALGNGATIELNTRTSIAVRKDFGVPAVELLSGEGIMECGAGAGARSVLVAGPGTSIGQGARFSARRDGSQVAITCITGAVQVTWRDKSLRLEAGRQVTYGDEEIGPVKGGVDLRVLTAWRSGTLIFQNMPMRTVVSEINRYRPGEVILLNGALATKRLTGTYQVARLDDFFSQAELAFGVRVTRLPGNVVLLS